MGYDFTIGEAEFDSYASDADDEPSVHVIARGEAHENAPTFVNDEMTGNTNRRSPGYVAWHDFCILADIEELFYGGGWNRDYRRYDSCSDDFHRETPLLAEHPGFQAIGRKDVNYLAKKLEEFKAKHPGLEPQFSNWDGTSQTGATLESAALARLIWLEYWFRWAVDNCKRPIIQNT